MGSLEESEDPDEMLYSAYTVASDQGQHGLPMSHKKDTSLIWINRES